MANIDYERKQLEAKRKAYDAIRGKADEVRRDVRLKYEDLLKAAAALEKLAKEATDLDRKAAPAETALRNQEAKVTKIEVEEAKRVTRETARLASKS